MATTLPLSFRRDDDVIHLTAVRPPGDGPFPGLILIPDVRGVSDHYVDVATRFAAEGFFTAVIDLYSREGAPDLADMQAVFAWIAALPDPRVLADLEGAVQTLAARPEVQRRRDRHHRLLPRRPVRVDGGVSDARASPPASVGTACCATRRTTSGSRRARWRWRRSWGVPTSACSAPTTRSSRRRTSTSCAKSSPAPARRSTSACYPDAGHAFFNDARPDAYRPAAAADAFPRAVRFLHEHLG